MKNFKSLRRDLATRNFRPELVTLPGGIAPPNRPQFSPAAPLRQALTTPLPEAGTSTTTQIQCLRRNQEAEQKPHPSPQMQIGPGFRTRMAIGEAAANGIDNTLKDDGFHFLLLYYLKGVWNTHCSDQHLHRPLPQIRFWRLVESIDCFCGREEAPPVQKVDTCKQSQAYTLSA